MSDAGFRAVTIQDAPTSDLPEPSQPGTVPIPHRYNPAGPSRDDPPTPCRLCPHPLTMAAYQCWLCNLMVCERCCWHFPPTGTSRFLCHSCDWELSRPHRGINNEAARANDEALNEGEEDEVFYDAESDFNDTLPMGPDTRAAADPIDSLHLSHPQGLPLQDVEQQSLDSCWVCGNFVPILQPCQYCHRLTCRHPACLSPTDINVCVNHIICQRCIHLPSVFVCRECHVHVCPGCASGDFLGKQEAINTEICCECAADRHNPWISLR